MSEVATLRIQLQQAQVHIQIRDARVVELQIQLREAQGAGRALSGKLLDAVALVGQFKAERAERWTEEEAKEGVAEILEAAAQELGVTIERGKGLYALYQQMRTECLRAVGVAQRAIEKGEATERDAAEQRALVKRLREAGVTDYSKATDANRVDCHFCPGVWRADEPAKHKTTCPLADAPTEAKEEGDGE